MAAFDPSQLVPTPTDSLFQYANRCIVQAQNFGATAGEALIFAALMLQLAHRGIFGARPWQ